MGDTRCVGQWTSRYGCAAVHDTPSVPGGPSSQRPAENDSDDDVIKMGPGVMGL